MEQPAQKPAWAQLRPMSEVAYSVQAFDWSGGKCRGKESGSLPGRSNHRNWYAPIFRSLVVFTLQNYQKMDSTSGNHLRERRGFGRVRNAHPFSYFNY